MYECAIIFNGDNDPANIGYIDTIECNGVVSSGGSFGDFYTTQNTITNSLADGAVTSVRAKVSSTATTSQIEANAGNIEIYVYIMYPSVAIEAVANVFINGAAQAIPFTKLPTT